MTDLAAAQAAAKHAYARAYWTSVGPGAPPHRIDAMRAARAEWEAAQAHVEALKAGQQNLFGDAA